MTRLGEALDRLSKPAAGAQPRASIAAEEKTGFRKISDEAVRARTGRGWEEWFAILDARGARDKGHTLAARHLREQYGLSGWWAQAVAIRYE